MNVAEILNAVRSLGEKEKNEFLAGLGEIDFQDAWDRQIEADIKAGRLNRLAEEALAERRISA
jgi:hypothetical protein